MGCYDGSREEEVDNDSSKDGPRITSSLTRHLVEREQSDQSMGREFNVEGDS